MRKNLNNEGENESEYTSENQSLASKSSIRSSSLSSISQINMNYIDIKNSQNDDIDYEDKNKIIYDILEDKGICEQLFKCPIIYQSLKENHKHILMIIFVIFLIMN